MAARNVSKLQGAVNDIRLRDGKAKAIQTDISDHKQVEQVVAQAVKDFGRIGCAGKQCCQGNVQ